MKNRCAAGIVLYNPDIIRLKRNITSIYEQVEIVYCFNNGSQNINEISEALSRYDNVILLGENKNLGIATALNKIAEKAIDNEIEWLLTLDQDSVCPDDMINKFCKYTYQERVGIICPLMVDKRRPISDLFEGEKEFVDFCITSGSFMRIQVYKDLGGFEDWLFIDLVDDDYCYKMRLCNYKILRINNITLDHELGNLTPSRFAAFYIRLGSLLHINKIKALSYNREVSPMRLYYATRNAMYLKRKYGEIFGNRYFNKLLILNSIFSVLRGKHKYKLLKCVISGLNDGKNKTIH